MKAPLGQACLHLRCLLLVLPQLRQALLNALAQAQPRRRRRHRIGSVLPDRRRQRRRRSDGKRRVQLSQLSPQRRQRCGAARWLA